MSHNEVFDSIKSDSKSNQTTPNQFYFFSAEEKIQSWVHRCRRAMCRIVEESWCSDFPLEVRAHGQTPTRRCHLLSFLEGICTRAWTGGGVTLQEARDHARALSTELLFYQLFWTSRCLFVRNMYQTLFCSIGCLLWWICCVSLNLFSPPLPQKVEFGGY